MQVGFHPTDRLRQPSQRQNLGSHQRCLGAAALRGGADGGVRHRHDAGDWRLHPGRQVVRDRRRPHSEGHEVNSEDQLQRLCEAQRAEIKRLGDLNSELVTALDRLVQCTIDDNSLERASFDGTIMGQCRAVLSRAKGQQP